MAVDPNIQPNGHNSFKVDDILRSFPFGVEGGHSHLTVHFSAWATSNLAEALRGATLFFNADGMRIERRTHVWSVPSMGFEQVVITQAIPEGAVKAQFEFLPNGNYWIVEPKGEFGEIASPFSINFANQLSQIGPTGGYLGFIRTNQIVMAGEDEEGLDAYLSTWNARMQTFQNRLTGATTNIDAEGIYTGKLQADQIEGGTIKATTPVSYGPFVRADLDKVADHLTRVKILTDSEILKYDINADGNITTADFIGIRDQINGHVPSIRTVHPAVRIQPRSLDFEGGIFFGNGDDINSSNSNFYMSKGEFKGRLLTVLDADISMAYIDTISTTSVHPRDSTGIIFYNRAGYASAGVNDSGFYTKFNANITGDATIGGLLNGMEMISYGSGGRGIGLPNGFRMAFETNKINFLNKNGQIIHTIE